MLSEGLVVGVCFFFFQAEDGIRDLTVTGVQTCALPIYGAALLAAAGEQGLAGIVAKPVSSPYAPGAGWLAVAAGERGPRVDISHPERSEERRVGKEGRSRWSPYH